MKIISANIPGRVDFNMGESVFHCMGAFVHGDGPCAIEIVDSATDAPSISLQSGVSLYSLFLFIS